LLDEHDMPTSSVDANLQIRELSITAPWDTRGHTMGDLRGPGRLKNMNQTTKPKAQKITARPTRVSNQDCSDSNSTGKNQNVFMPPTSVRGDVARSLMYMAIRYDGSDENTERLLLGECPCMETSTMGILSVLLQWHSDDPPSDAELARNDAICRRYQKNRNPFIDMPELAAKAFAEFAQVGGSVTCPPCVSISRDISTSSLKPQTLVVQASSSGASSTTNPLLPLLTPMPRSGAWASSTSLGVVLLVFSGCMLGMWL